jgi:Homeodomain
MLAAPVGSQLHCQPARGPLSVRLPEVNLTATESPRLESLIGTQQGQESNTNNRWRRQPTHANSSGESLDSRFDTGSARSSLHADFDLRAREARASSALLSLSAPRHAGHQHYTSPSLELSSPSQHGSLQVSGSDVSHHSPFLPASSSRAPTSPYDHPVLPLPPSSYAGPAHASRHHHDRHHHNLRSLASPYPPPHSHVSSRRTVSPPDASRSGVTGSGTGKGAGETAGGKKRRARATPEQLEILNQVYARTPFPSTQERIDLAATLDMTPRSVQIWYVMISFIAIISLGGAS